jgi:phosphoribosylaminoimidazole-succinocarboxamide synthase
MARRTKIYEGKAKVLYEGPEPGTMVQYFKDDATAFNAEKRDVIEGKGVLNNMLSEYFMTGLNQIGRAHAFHPPPEHARATDPRGRDYSAWKSWSATSRQGPCPNGWGSRRGHNCPARLSSSI